jgi:hypothetical protein
VDLFPIWFFSLVFQQLFFTTIAVNRQNCQVNNRSTHYSQKTFLKAKFSTLRNKCNSIQFVNICTTGLEIRFPSRSWLSAVMTFPAFSGWKLCFSDHWSVIGCYLKSCTTRARARFLAIFQIWLWEQLETCKLATHGLPDLRLTYILFTAMEDGFVSCLFLHSFAEIIKLNKNKTSIALLKKLPCTNCQNTECIHLRQFKIHTLYVVVLDGTILASLSMLNDIKWKWSTVLTDTISTLARYGLP